MNTSTDTLRCPRCAEVAYRPSRNVYRDCVCDGCGTAWHKCPVCAVRVNGVSPLTGFHCTCPKGKRRGPRAA